MSNGTLDPRSLTSEERAWCDAIAVALCSSGNYSAAGAISEAVTLGLPERRALFGEPASEGGKVECPNCGGEAAYFDEHHDGYEFLCAPCKPAQPEPVAAEMPEAMRNAANSLRACAVKARYPAILTERADALESFWRSLAAQPAPSVAMTEELERVLDAAEAQAGWHMDQGRPESFDEIDAAIASVRSQAAEAVDASAIYDKGFADGIALQKKCAAEAGKVPDCVIHAVRLRRSYLCDLPNSDYGKEQALEMRTIEDWLRAAEGRK